MFCISKWFNFILSSFRATKFMFLYLATFNKDSAFSTEAGLKYFILGALSSGFLLFGISLIYGATGTTNFETLAKAIYFFDFNFRLWMKLDYELYWVVYLF